MPRTFTAVHHAIWQDDDWRDLSPEAQHLYFVLLTAPELSFCGVGDWRPRRFLPLAKGWRMNDFNAAAAELSQALLIIVDQESEEYLIRSFLRHDGVMQHNKTCISAMTAFGKVASNQIRGVISHELNRLKSEFPEWECWARPQVREVLKRRSVAPGLAPNVAPRSAPGVAPQSGKSSPRVSPPVRPPHTPAPTPAPESQEREAPAESDDLPLPSDFTPTEDHKAKAKSLKLDIDDVMEDFRLWIAEKPRTSRSWNATFMAFIKRRGKFAEIDRAKGVTPRGTSSSPAWGRGVPKDPYGLGEEAQ